jgi:hypothetical protein
VRRIFRFSDIIPKSMIFTRTGDAGTGKASTLWVADP